MARPARGEPRRRSGDGRQVEAYYFAFGDDDVFAIGELPDNETAAGYAMEVASSGESSVTVTVLLTPEEIDRAREKHSGSDLPAPEHASPVEPYSGRMSASPRERMLAGTGATTRTLDVGGVDDRAHRDRQTARPLLLLHGGIECGAAMWGPVLAQLGLALSIRRT